MREEEAPQIADAKKCEGLCIFSSLPAISFLHLCTQPPTPEMLLLAHSVAHLRGRLLQEPFCSYTLCFQDCLFIGPCCSVTDSCCDSVWGSMRTRPLSALFPSLACPSQSLVPWRRLRTEWWSANGACIFG